MSNEKAHANDSLTTSHLEKSLTTSHYKQQIQTPQASQSQGQAGTGIGQSGNSGQSSNQEK
jgi:hypothetical protein